MILARTAALLFAVAAMPAIAQTGAAPASAKPEKKICRRYEETGSIMGGKSICHTKAEWSAIDQHNSENVSASRDVAGHAGQMGGGRVN